LEDRRSIGAGSCNSGDGTDQRVQYLMFMMMMMTIFCLSYKKANIKLNIKHGSDIFIVSTVLHLGLLAACY